MENNNNRGHSIAITIILALAWVAAAINPYDRSDRLLENLLVFAGFGALLISFRKFPVSPTAYWLITLFLCLHLYGSHYTYARTPLGYWMQDILHQTRNHYDRVVHFSFGLLLTLPLMELLRQRANVAGIWLKIFTLSVMLSFSAIYELLEMAATLIVNPELGSAFLGTQGDEWDAQKDTGLAALGTLIALILCRRQIRIANHA